MGGIYGRIVKIGRCVSREASLPRNALCAPADLRFGKNRRHGWPCGIWHAWLRAARKPGHGGWSRSSAKSHNYEALYRRTWSVARKSARDRPAVVPHRCRRRPHRRREEESDRTSDVPRSADKEKKKKAVGDEFSPARRPAKNNLAGPAPITQRYSLMIFKRFLSSWPEFFHFFFFFSFFSSLFFFVDVASVLLLHARTRNYDNHKTIKLDIRRKREKKRREIIAGMKWVRKIA